MNKLKIFLEKQYALPSRRNLKEKQIQQVVHEVVTSLVDQVVDMVNVNNNQEQAENNQEQPESNEIPAENNQEQPEMEKAEDMEDNEPVVIDAGDITTDSDLHDMMDRYIKAVEELDRVQTEVKDLKEKWQATKSEKWEMGQELATIKTQFKQKVKNVDELREKIGKYSPRNVNKRVNRLKEANQKMNDEIENLKGEKDTLIEQNSEIKEKLESITHEKWNKSKLVDYYKGERDKIKDKSGGCDKCNDMREKYNEILEYVSHLEEKLEDMQTDADGKKVIKTYEKGHYSDKVVKLYINLLTKYNVGARNATSVVREVLSELGDLEAERLPKYTWVTQVLIRARTLSQIQVLEELLKGVLHLLPKIGMFVLYLKIINNCLKNKVCIL